MRKPIKKWKRAYDMYVNYNFTISTIAQALRIRHETLHEWQRRYGWDRHRTLVMLNGQHLLDMYIDQCTALLNRAVETSRMMSADDLRLLNTFTRGYHDMVGKQSPMNVTKVLVNFYEHVHYNRPALARQVRGSIQDYLSNALLAQDDTTIKAPRRKALVKNRYQNWYMERWANLPQ